MLDLSAVPISEDAYRLAKQNADQVSPLDHALQDGEDFELIMAAAPDEVAKLISAARRPVQMTVIGRLVDRLGLWQISPDGIETPLIPRGYEHPRT